jgi:hypothetical protein
MSSDIAAIKRLRDHVRRNPTMFKDAHTVLVALQKAAVSIAEGERIEAEHDEAIERLGKAIAQANQAVADLQALEASIVPKRSEFQRTLFEIEVEFDARYAERIRCYAARLNRSRAGRATRRPLTLRSRLSL